MQKMIEHADAASAVAGTAAATKAGAFGASVGIGLLGGLLMIVLDPPKTRRGMFLQSMVALVGSVIFGPLAVRVLDHYSDAVDLSKADFEMLLTVAGPVYFLMGAMSWGVAAALVKLRHLIAEHAADAAAERLGFKDDE
jgi:hypothetical protein